MMADIKVQPNLITFNAAISACEKGREWKKALSVIDGMLNVSVEPDIVSFNAALSACYKTTQWQHSLGLFNALPKADIIPDVLSFTVAISTFEQSGRVNSSFAWSLRSCNQMHEEAFPTN